MLRWGLVGGTFFKKGACCFSSLRLALLVRDLYAATVNSAGRGL